MQLLALVAVFGISAAKPPPALKKTQSLGLVTSDNAAKSERAALACGTHTLNAGSYVIKSPNFPDNYNTNDDCSYTLQPGARVGTISLSCSDFHLESDSSCRYDYLVVSSSKFCGKSTTGPRVAVSGTMAIRFHSDDSEVRKGFQCTITASTRPPTGGCSCGVANHDTRIVGGIETLSGEYPWQAGLVFRGQSRTYCGGSLINDRYVLTAAHCVPGISAADIEVLLGDHRIGRPDGESRHAVSSIISHPAFRSTLQGHDYSLVKLAAPVTFTTRRSTVCLPTAGQTYVGANATATGFGRIGMLKEQSDWLRKLALPVLSQAACATKWGSTIRDTMICAGGSSQGGKSTCMGDSGGPLVTLENGKYALIGVVSFGKPCAKPDWPDVFARVTEALPWIRDNTKDATYCS